MQKNEKLVQDFPAMHLVRTGRLVRLFGRITFITLVVTVIGMIFVPWRQTSRGYGQVVALDPQQRPQPVLSPVKGVIETVKSGLREGTKVEEGEMLIKLAPFANEAVSIVDSQILFYEAKLVAGSSSLKQAELAAEMQESSNRSLIESLSQDLRAAREKWEQTKNEVNVSLAELADKKNKFRIDEQVATRGLISRGELFSSQQDVEAQKSKVLKAESSAEEAYASLQSIEFEIESKKQDLEIKIRSANKEVLEEIQKLRTYEKELADLRAKRSEYDRLEIKAPRSGVIQQWNGLEGSDTVKEGDQLFVIVPDATELAVELSVSGNDMPLIKEGDHVRLQFEGWPAVQFVGWPSVAIGTFGGKVNRVFPTDDGKGSFKLVVTPDRSFDGETDWPDNRYLRQGVRANGWVLLRQVTLGFEIWRQINGFPPVVADEEPKEKKDSKSKVKVPKP